MQSQIPLARRDVIAARLAEGQAVVAAALALEFEISEDAIRRDLRALAAEGLCRRVYGGALPASRAMADRIDLARPSKEALARVAVRAVEPGEFLFLDAGSTNLALTSFLPFDSELTVATNSIDIAGALLRRPDIRLVMIGGRVDATVGGSVDAAAVQALATLNIDRCFLGACAVDPKRGVGAELHDDALFKRALVAASRRCMVLALNEKFEARAPHRVCHLADVDLLVVEHDAPGRFLKPLKAAGVSLSRAAPAA
jgi:DeoR/GlpR family transcriptional regulator of sugar metabolism